MPQADRLPRKATICKKKQILFSCLRLWRRNLDGDFSFLSYLLTPTLYSKLSSFTPDGNGILFPRSLVILAVPFMRAGITRCGIEELVSREKDIMDSRIRS